MNNLHLGVCKICFYSEECSTFFQFLLRKSTRKFDMMSVPADCQRQELKKKKQKKTFHISSVWFGWAAVIANAK